MILALGVIPAQAGIPLSAPVQAEAWVPAVAGTTVYLVAQSRARIAS